MSQIILSKLRLKEGGDQIWRAWCEELKGRREKAIAILIKESVRIEVCFIDEEYISILMIAKSMEQASKSVKKEPHWIDRDHRRNMRLSIIPPDNNPNLEYLFYLEVEK